MPDNDVSRKSGSRAAMPLHRASLAPGYEDLLSDIPQSADTVPSMMSIGERRLLYNLALRRWTGKGIIVDAGLMLGASSVLFGKAVQERDGPRRRVVVAIERAIADFGGARFIQKHVPEANIEVGDDFSKIVRQFVDDVGDVVDLRIGDIRAVGSTSRGIEILFLDVIKESDVGEYCIKNYFPWLFAGSFVVQQDYFIDSLPWIREQQEHLNLTGRMAYVGEIGSTAVFQCRSRPSQASCDEACQAFPYEHVVRLLSAAEQRSIDPYRRLLCGLVRVWRAAEMRDQDEATAVFYGIKQTYAAQIAENKTKRIERALNAANYLCLNPWNGQTELNAQLLSAGHEIIPPAAQIGRPIDA